MTLRQCGIGGRRMPSGCGFVTRRGSDKRVEDGEVERLEIGDGIWDGRR